MLNPILLNPYKEGYSHVIQIKPQVLHLSLKELTNFKIKFFVKCDLKGLIGVRIKCSIVRTQICSINISNLT